MAERTVYVADEFEVKCPACAGGLISPQHLPRASTPRTCFVCNGDDVVTVYVEGETIVDIDPENDFY